MLTTSNVLYDAGLSMSEKVSTSLTTLIFGMLVVFSVLTLIMVVIMIVGKIFQSIDKKKASETSVPSDEVKDTPVEESAEDEGAIVAAITAAIALYTEEQPGSFRVVSFRKTSAKSAWNKK